ncbi:MAG TPA: L-aspartate oxidase [Candidatus Nanopelagicales bacterium]
MSSDPAQPSAALPPGPLIIPTTLAAPEPGWTTSADVIVIGSGVAGLSLALNIRRLGHRVLIVTKSYVEEGSTRWAQGGIAAALAADDSPADHERDTLVAGAGLCDPAAVHVLCTSGPASVRNLIRVGARFDHDTSGDIALTREGGHLRDRIAHAGGDATGAEIFRALVAAIADDPGIELVEHALALDLLLDERGAVQGITLHVIGEGQRDGVGAVLAPVVVLATGGLGQVFAQTTNPAVATGDGVALALRAGADVADLEFVQFHPTVMYLGPDSMGQQPLVSEAVRGEGAFLVDDAGVRFMLGQHPLADLAPRDVVAKAIMRRMREQGRPHMWLDARALGERWQTRFPTILESCRRHGIDPARDLIPVAPAQHYASGGVRTDLDGRASITGLYAAGEVACTGVHGANRLASNSLLEGLVFPERIVAAIAAGLPERREPVARPAHPGLVAAADRRPMQQLMTDGVGVLRSAASMRQAIAGLHRLVVGDLPHGRSTEDWEATNLHAVASVLAAHALAREETRGSHWREDFPKVDDARWRVRLVASADADGTIRTRQEPVPPHDSRTPGT